MTIAPTGADPTRRRSPPTGATARSSSPTGRSLRLGQRTALIEGDIVWVPGPSPWPWALLTLVAFAVVAATGWRRWYGLLALLVVVAVAADLVHTAGAFAASTAPVVAKVYGFLISAAGWVAAILAVWQLRRGRLQAGRILLLLAGTFLAFAGALPDVGALARSQLASALDPTLPGPPSRSPWASGSAWSPPAC
jgi:hypothetical protein